jgi:hypothetical protein
LDIAGEVRLRVACQPKLAIQYRASERRLAGCLGRVSQLAAGRVTPNYDFLRLVMLDDSGKPEVEESPVLTRLALMYFVEESARPCRRSSRLQRRQPGPGRRTHFSSGLLVFAHAMTRVGCPRTGITLPE